MLAQIVKYNSNQSPLANLLVAVVVFGALAVCWQLMSRKKPPQDGPEKK